MTLPGSVSELDMIFNTAPIYRTSENHSYPRLEHYPGDDQATDDEAVKVISNSSPLINFGALGRLDILRTLYDNLFIPEAVYHEVVVAGQRHPGAATVREATWIVQEAVTNIPAVMGSP